MITEKGNIVVLDRFTDLVVPAQVARVDGLAVELLKGSFDVSQMFSVLHPVLYLGN